MIIMFRVVARACATHRVLVRALFGGIVLVLIIVIVTVRVRVIL